jgi:4-amino-4-deoxy-L-arabinose transferase-like glycosyltransferase
VVSNISKYLLLLLLIALVALNVGNAERALDKVQESRVAETAREMTLNQQWLLPHFNGELRLQKPPLTYWTTAAALQLFGVNERAIRIPSMLFGIATALLMFLWLSQRIDPATGFATALVVLTCFLGMRYFRSAEADATLIFFISLSIYAIDRLGQGLGHLHHWQRYLMLALGLAFLSKGPAGLAIPLLTLLLWVWRGEGRKVLPTFKNVSAWTLFLISAFGWYAWILLTMPDIASMFFSKQLDDTFVSGTHPQPLYWYAAHAIEFFSPWGILLIPAAWFYWRERPKQAVLRLAGWWTLVVMVLLTLTVNKQVQYALLFVPPVAILLAYYLVHAQGGWRRLNLILGLVVWLASVLFLVYLMLHHGVQAATLAWALWLLIGLLMFRFWGEPSSRVLFVWAFSACAIYLLSEQYISQSDSKRDVHDLAIQSKDLRPMWQLKPGNGAISFYAGDIVPMTTLEQLPNLAAQHRPFWLICKNSAKLDGVHATEVMRSGDWVIWKVE